MVATGVAHAYFGHDEWAPLAPGLKTLEDATEVRARVLVAFERAERQADAGSAAAWLTFVMVGGGPTGVELAGALAEIARQRRWPSDFRRIDPRQSRASSWSRPGPRILPTFPPIWPRRRGETGRRGGRSALRPSVELVDERGVVVGGERIAAALRALDGGRQADAGGGLLGAAPIAPGG